MTTSLLPGYGIVEETEEATSLLPGYGILQQTEAAAPSGVTIPVLYRQRQMQGMAT